MKESFSRIFGFNDNKTTAHDEVNQIPVANIVTSPYQPRSVFDDERIEELAQTIKTHGVIQPIVVRVRGGKFEIIAGERRYRAVQKLGWATIPAIIKDFNDAQAASIALIENLQREGLTAIEEAVAYHKLIELHNLTQESLAQRLGKSQSTIANKLRLLGLCEPVKNALMERNITERHARALLQLPNEALQLKLLEEVRTKELNVKQTEARVKFYTEATQTQKKPKRKSFAKDVRLAINTVRQSVDMVNNMGMAVKIDEEDYEDHYEIVIKIPKKRD
jgi:ParB family chromosome partitioning protein